MNRKTYCLGALFLLTALLSPFVVAEDPRPLLRFPDIHGQNIVFAHGGDLWRASSTGGIARRLTVHDGGETYPKFSPDGSLIAFTGEYDGNSDVYVMDTHGGNIRRVTYHPSGDDVVGWHPGKSKIIFRSTRNSFSRFTRLYLIDPNGSGLEEVPLHEAAAGSFSPDGTKIAYNRVTRENRTWKRYRGGLAQEIYSYDFNLLEERNLSSYTGTDRTPMWIGEKIFFSSDRDGFLNLYSIRPDGSSLRQWTHHDRYDVRRPSAGKGKIVYEHGGAIWTLDTNTGKAHEVKIEIRADAPEARPHWKSVDDDVTSIDISPDGKRALITARGEIFSVPKKRKGQTYNLTQSSSARDQHARWSPDGEHIAYLSDRSGEYEVYVTDSKGLSEPTQLTKHDRGYRHTLRWSPDSKKIAFADQELRCLILDVESKTITSVDQSSSEPTDVALDRKPIFDYVWSPDSRFLSYSKIDEDLVSKVYIYSLETGTNHCASQGLFNDFNPVFSTDGKHLFFISNRRFSPTYCDFEWELVYKKMAGIYCLTLTRDGDPRFGLETDDPSESEEESESKANIDFGGLAERIEAVPLPRGNYRDLAVNESHLFYLNADDGDFNRFEYRELGGRTLHAYSLADREEETVTEKVDEFRLSADGKSIAYRKDTSVGILASSARKSSGKNLSLRDLKMWYEPVAEWTQIFNEAWRMERDFFYDENMHGLDWDDMKEKYGRLIPSASCRQDVRFIIGELIGELNASHTYVFGGDSTRSASRVNVGMLGVDWIADQSSGRYRFGKIYRVADWTRETFPPLSTPGLNIEEGDYLFSVNGHDLHTSTNLFRAFQNLARKQVRLLVGKTTDPLDAREVVVKTIPDERTLRYQDWVEHNRRTAEEASGGKIGYIHLPDTYNGSAREFPRTFYSQTQKQGLIIDGRFNGGGLDPDIFLQRLHKKPLAYWTRRYSVDQTTPAVVTQAHMVCLTNRQAGSGGDMLPMEFRQKKMGEIIGTRTWGGLVGVSMFLTSIDGGGLTAPDYRIYDPQGNWIVENVGVTPDIEVDLHPGEMIRGYDAQLTKGIEVLLKKIADHPPTRPDHPPFPIERAGSQ